MTRSTQITTVIAEKGSDDEDEHAHSDTTKMTMTMMMKITMCVLTSRLIVMCMCEGKCIRVFFDSWLYQIYNRCVCEE